MYFGFVVHAALIAIAFLSFLLMPSASAADLEAELPIGDPAKGRHIFYSCKACHSLDKNGEHKIGPNLYGVFGRKAGSAKNFKHYSAALKDAEFIWTEEELDRWLAAPNAFLPGNKMSFAGLRRAEDRNNLIAYLREQTAP